MIVAIVILGCVISRLTRLPTAEGNTSEYGTSEEYGTVVVCHHGTEVGVCGDEWKPKETMVVCRQLGFPSAESQNQDTVHKDAKLTTLILMCNGDESHLMNCTQSTNSTCNFHVKVTCAPNSFCGGSEDHSIRVVNWTSTEGGIVELCIDNLWKMACHEQWGETETSLACGDLRQDSNEGIVSEGVRPISDVINCSTMTSPKSLINCQISGIHCNSTESPKIMCPPLILSSTTPTHFLMVTCISPTSSFPMDTSSPTSSFPMDTSSPTSSMDTSSSFPMTSDTLSPTSSSLTSSFPMNTMSSSPTLSPVTNTTDQDHSPETAVYVMMGLLLTVAMVAISAVSALIVVLKRKTKNATFQNESPANDGALEVDNAIYDNPFQGANYSTIQRTLGEKERQEEEWEGEKHENPTYERWRI